MTKKEKIFLLLILLCFFLLVYIVLFSKPINKNPQIITEKTVMLDNTPVLKPSVDLKILEENYKQALRVKFRVFENEIKIEPVNAASGAIGFDPIAAKSNEMREQIKNLKNEILSMTVPADMRRLHVSFVLALDKFENYVVKGSASDKLTSLNFLQETKNKYNWLVD